jgi:tRNA(adenine34) deaminase
VITDAQGQIVSRGRNRIREKVAEGKEFAGNRLAHAELNALIALDWSAVDVYGCQLHSIIEPCPMCIGAVRMAHMREVHYAVRDGGAGATSLIDKTPFFESGQMVISAPADTELELVLMALQVEATLSQAHPKPWEWINLLAKDLPRAATLGNQLFEERLLVQWKEEARDADFVLDQMHERLLHLA